MRIGLAQMDCAVGEIDSNCAKIAEFSARARTEGCDVVVFPEMSDLGYVTSVIAEKAQTWSQKPFETITLTVVPRGKPLHTP